MCGPTGFCFPKSAVSDMFVACGGAHVRTARVQSTYPPRHPPLFRFRGPIGSVILDPGGGDGVRTDQVRLTEPPTPPPFISPAPRLLQPKSAQLCAFAASPGNVLPPPRTCCNKTFR